MCGARDVDECPPCMATNFARPTNYFPRFRTQVLTGFRSQASELIEAVKLPLAPHQHPPVGLNDKNTSVRHQTSRTSSLPVTPFYRTALVFNKNVLSTTFSHLRLCRPCNHIPHSREIRSTTDPNPLTILATSNIASGVSNNRVMSLVETSTMDANSRRWANRAIAFLPSSATT